jgi:hypothetical protein
MLGRLGEMLRFLDDIGQPKIGFKGVGEVGE